MGCCGQAGRGAQRGDGMVASHCFPGDAVWGPWCASPKRPVPALLRAGEVMEWDKQFKPGSSTGSKHNVQLFFFFLFFSL